MIDRKKYPPQDFQLKEPNPEYATWEQAAMYETAFQLARISDSLDQIVNAMPNTGRGH